MISFMKLLLIVGSIQLLLTLVQSAPSKDIQHRHVRRIEDASGTKTAEGPTHLAKVQNINLPVNEDLEGLVDEALDNPIGSLETIPSGEEIAAYPATGEGVLAGDDGEDMETADNIVFRPLFRYKKQSVEKRRVFRDRNGNISSRPVSSTVKPAPASNPPQILVYDRVSGSYYPIPNSPYYANPNGQNYPVYFRGQPAGVRRN